MINVALNFLSRKSPNEIKSLLRQAIAASILDGHEELAFRSAIDTSKRKEAELPREGLNNPLPIEVAGW